VLTEGIRRGPGGSRPEEIERRRPGITDTFFAGSTPGVPGKEWFLRPETVAEAIRFALRLPPEARLEEVVIRSSSQPPEY